jgi:hypothetical protein
VDQPPALDDAAIRPLVAIFKAPPEQQRLIADYLRKAHQGAWKWGKDWKSPSVASYRHFLVTA